LLTVVEAGRLLSVGRTTVYELIERGDLRAVHIGRACRVPVVEVTDYIERLRAIDSVTPHSYLGST
jgi:excisionase family DNA binding protein